MGARRDRLLICSAALLFLPALFTFGYVRGHWMDALRFEGTANTGVLGAGWTWWHTCQEYHTWPLPPQLPGDLGEVGGLDVGSTTISIDPSDPSLLHFTILNGYPSYAVDCEVEFSNSGTVPWIVRGNTIQPISSNLTGCALSGMQTKRLACDQLTVVFADNIGAQVDPGDSVASSLRVHVEQPALQNSAYQFNVDLCVSQWNENATFSQCMAAP